MSKIFDALQKAMKEGTADSEAAAVPAAPKDSAGGESASAFLDALASASVKDPSAIAVADTPVVRVVTAQVNAAEPVLPFDQPSSIESEQYRILRVKLFQHPLAPHTIAVSSPCPGDGKTITSVNLAIILALAPQKRIVLVETDLRRPRLAKLLGLPTDGPGVAQVLTGRCSLNDALIQVEQNPALCVLLAGQPGDNPAELFDSAAWQKLCQQLRQEFSYAVFDAPPFASVAEANIIQNTVDGIVLVVRPDQTKRTTALQTFKTIEEDRLLGVVVNASKKSFFDRRGHGYYYYADRDRQ